jgi:hypothetical protein
MKCPSRQFDTLVRRHAKGTCSPIGETYTLMNIYIQKYMNRIYCTYDKLTEKKNHACPPNAGRVSGGNENLNKLKTNKCNAEERYGIRKRLETMGCVT